MKNTNLKKCSLSLQINERDKLKYKVSPATLSVNVKDNIETYNYIIDINTPFQINVGVYQRDGNTSNIIVKNVKVDDIEIALSNISIYRTKDNKIKDSHNFLDEVGTYQIKIHMNPISQNYLNFILNLTKN